MSRPASGDDEVLANAREAIAAAQTVEQLRQAQAVVIWSPFNGRQEDQRALLIAWTPRSLDSFHRTNAARILRVTRYPMTNVGARYCNSQCTR